MSEEEIETVTIMTNDGDEHVVPSPVANMSETIKNLREDAGDENAIPIPNVTSPIFKKVIQYCQYHYDNPLPQQDAEAQADADDNGKNEVAEKNAAWDAEFVKVDQATLFEIILAANFLDIPTLLDMTCTVVANMIKGKTPEEIRQTFNIKNDFTPEEEEQVKKENEWVEAN